ncbi:MAG: hypothetical protein KDI63_02755 [Gammaproteobacteria bacterium]|nr:hypothetical protein [Gammaproteobacteria bacterium]
MRLADRAAGLPELGLIVTLRIRFEDFETHTRQHKLTVPTHDERMILREAWTLFLHGKLPRKPVRLIRVGISDWQHPDSEPAQADFPELPQKKEKDDRLLETLDRVADRCGKGKLQLGYATKSDKRKSR